MASKSITQIVRGAVKFARLQTDRDRITRFGLASKNRAVQEEMPDIETTLNDMESGQFTERHRDIVLGQIDEFSTSLRARELVRRCLFNGESTAELADELGMKKSTARSTVFRAKRFLGIPHLKS